MLVGMHASSHSWAEALYAHLVDRLDAYVCEALCRQVMDPAHRAYGAFISPEYGRPAPDQGSHVFDLAAACHAYLAAGGRYAASEALLARILPAIAFQRSRQRPSGLIDLVCVNPESPPDTAFTLLSTAPLVAACRRRAGEGGEAAAGAARIAEALGAYVRSAAAGVLGRGFHTPNHRWGIGAALAHAMTLFPDFDARSYIHDILAETVDINADGQYSERSIAGYDGIVNRSLRMMADHLGRPDLLDMVRHNLDFTLHLLHPDQTAFTSLSRRQDRARRAMPASADSCLDMAARDGNGVWAALADRILKATDTPQLAALQVFLDRGADALAAVPRVPPPDDYRRHFPAAGVWRVRRGDLSATAVAGDPCAFALRFGQVELAALKLARCLFPGTRFEGDEMDAIADGVRLVQRADRRLPPGYDLPLGRPVPFDGFDALRASDYDLPRARQERLTLERLRLLHADRTRWTLPALDVIMEIIETDGGFDLAVRTTGGLDGIPFQIECCFEAPGEWETADSVCEARAGSSAILTGGHGIYHVGGCGLRIGPGAGAHRMWHMRGTEAEPGMFRVLIPLETPVAHTLQLRYGRWHAAAPCALHPAPTVPGIPPAPAAR